jgi:hypothetical protein
MNKMKKMTAISFYKQIEKDKDKYKLINGLFIVKFLDEYISVYIGDFLIKSSSRNTRKTNMVWINDSNPKPQRFYKNGSKLMTTSGLGIWKKLNIGFKETPIEDIIK